MPYVLIKRKNGYLIMNKETGKTYSNKPMTEMKAHSQLRILESLYNREKR